MELSIILGCVACVVAGVLVYLRHRNKLHMEAIASGRVPNFLLEKYIDRAANQTFCGRHVVRDHNWVIVLKDVFLVKDCDERYIRISAECSRCRARTRCEVRESNWWEFGLSDDPSKPKIKEVDATQEVPTKEES